MSIYSGFATRQQQETYDHSLNSLLFILQKRILKFYTNEKTDQYKFTSLVQKIYLQMRHMQKSKYLDPKCSYAIQQLFEYLIKENHTENNATVQENSIVEENVKARVNHKKPIDQHSFGSSNQELYGNQKTYQIPIRTQKSSPNKKAINQSSINVSRKISRILSSKSRQKHHTIALETSKNVIRQRLPSASQGLRLVQKKIVPHKQREQLLHRQRNLSFNEGAIRPQRQFARSSARMQPESNIPPQQHEINEIIQGYMKNAKRLGTASQMRSRNKLHRSISGQRHFFSSKG